MLNFYRFITFALMFGMVGFSSANAADIEKTCGKIVRLKADDTAKIFTILEDDLDLVPDDSANLVQLISQKLAQQEDNSSSVPYAVDDCIVDIKNTAIQ